MVWYTKAPLQIIGVIPLTESRVRSDPATRSPAQGEQVGFNYFTQQYHVPPRIGSVRGLHSGALNPPKFATETSIKSGTINTFAVFHSTHLSVSCLYLMQYAVSHGRERRPIY